MTKQRPQLSYVCLSGHTHTTFKTHVQSCNASAKAGRMGEEAKRLFLAGQPYLYCPDEPYPVKES